MTKARKVKIILYELLFLLCIIVLKLFLFEIFYVPTISMQKTLYPGDRVLVLKIMGKVKYLDIIIFKHPINKMILVKRCIGLPKDTILYEKKNIFINGQHVLMQEAINHDNILINNIAINKQYKLNEDLILIPDKNYLMLGDNRNNSTDSRNFGFVPEENIIGKTTLVLFNFHNGKFRWDRVLKKIK